MAKKAKSAAKTAAAKRPAAKAKTQAAKPAAKHPVAAKPAAKVSQTAAARPAAKGQAAKPAPGLAPVQAPPPKLVEAASFRGFKRTVFDRLAELRQELIDEIHALSDSSLVFDRNPGEELADIGSENFLREMELGMMSEEEKKLVLVESALRRLNEGGFGTCAECAGKIQEGRLLAIPYARLCVKCKAKREAEEAEGVAAQPEAIQLTE